MSSSGIRAAMAATFLAATVASAQAPRAAPALTDSAARVDSLFSRYATRRHPGCAVGVARNGRPILARAYGMAHLEHDAPNTTETIFEAGSVSKQFTAAAVLLLAQDGKLSLDDPVRKYVPEVPDYGAPITIRQMLNHTSGLRDWGTVAAAAGWPRGSRIYTHDHVLDIVSRQKALNYPPGTEYLYTNTGYNLAAIIVERVSGKSLPEFTRERIFAPLGMTRTGWRDDFTRVVPGRATAYRIVRDTSWTTMPNENVYGNSSLLTTVGDLLKWNENFVHATVGGPAFLEEMQRRGKLASGREITYAAGIVVSTWRGIPEVSHTGATAGYRAYLGRFPRQALSIAVLCNAGNANPDALGHGVARVFLADALAAQAAEDTVGVQLTTAQLQRWAGTYRDTRTNEALRLVVRGNRLVLQSDGGGGGELVPVSPTEFRSPSGLTRGIFEQRGRNAPVLRVVADGDTTTYVIPRPALTTPAALAQYAGTYTSDEAEVTYTVTVDSGRVMLRRRPGTKLELSPAYEDGFTSPVGVVVFTRNRQGRVDGMSLGLGRVRDLRLRKSGTR